MRSLQRPGRSPVLAPEGMASTSNPLSTQAAVTVLQNGGNAMDAAIAACAVQGVVEPESTGIGGDCFCLYSQAGSDKVIAMNGSGRAPMGLTADWLLEQGITEIPQQSPHAVTVPTAIDAWVQLSRDYGSKPLGDLLQPAIAFCWRSNVQKEGERREAQHSQTAESADPLSRCSLRSSSFDSADSEKPRSSSRRRAPSSPPQCSDSVQ